MSTGRGYLFGEGGIAENRREFKDIFGISPRKHMRQQNYERDLYSMETDPMFKIMQEEKEFMNNLGGDGTTATRPAGFDNLSKRQQNRYLRNQNPRIISKSDPEDIISKIDLSVDGSNEENKEIINEEKNKDSTMVTAMIGAASQAIQGLTGIASGIIGQRRRNAEARAAKRDFNDQMSMYKSMDTSNPFANIQNTYEDLTVNQQQAQFTAEQQQLGMATAMGQMRGAAGSSGVAAMAQAMANQQSTNLQKASASIGEQEARNQALSAKGAADRERMLAQGEKESRLMEFGKRRDVLQMSSQRKLAADQAVAAGKQAVMSGVGNLLGAGAAFGAGKLLDQG
jgi:hypothetical protein